MNSEDTVSIVEPDENKHMTKSFCILFRYGLFYYCNVFKKEVGQCWKCFYVSVEGGLSPEQQQQDF